MTANRPGLDALEKRLRDLRIVLKSGEYNGADLMRAWCAMIDAADMIAELKEARGLLSDIHERATQGHKQAGCDNWRAVERCRQIANLTERAFLARNGKGEG